MREVWRQAHLKQPLGSRDGSRTRQRGGSGPKSTTGGSRGGSSSMGRAGGSYIKLQVRDPIDEPPPPRPRRDSPEIDAARPRLTSQAQ